MEILEELLMIVPHPADPLRSTGENRLDDEAGFARDGSFQLASLIWRCLDPVVTLPSGRREDGRHEAG